MTQPEGIEVEGLVREFRKGPRAVDGIDLEVAPGEIYGFLGPNGAGKSTTVLVLTTLLPPTSGTARVAGYDVVRQGPDVRARIGAALQEAALDPFLTGADHMRLQTAMHGLPKADRIARSRELLARVGLTEAADRKVGGYSGGMKRRLDLALALVHRPKILFLDEPTTGLDVQSRTALWDDVARLARDDGVTVFLTTQYLEEADALADRVGIIDHGRLVAEGTPADLKAQIGQPTVEAIPGDDTIAVPDDLIPRRGRSYVLKVRGNSMIDDHIKDGDYLVVHERNQADNGQTIVALVHGTGATVKKFHREPGGWIRLDPANPAMSPLRIHERDIVVQGVVVGVIRKY